MRENRTYGLMRGQGRALPFPLYSTVPEGIRGNPVRHEACVNVNKYL